MSSVTKTDEKVSIVISPAEHLLAGGSEQEGVFILRHVAALSVYEGRILVDDAAISQVIQG